MDDLGGAAHAVVEAEAGLFLGRHAGQAFLHRLQGADGGQVGLQHHVQLQEVWGIKELGWGAVRLY